MAKSNLNEINLKITIDGKEAVATINVTDQQLGMLYQTASQFDNQPLLQQFTKDLLAVDAASEEAVEGISQFIKYNELSEQQIESVLMTLREQQKLLAVGSDQWERHGRAINNLTSAYQSTSTSQRNTRSSTGALNTAIGQMGYVMNDAQMFLVNFRMGLMGVSNNIPMVVQLLSQAKTQAASMGTTLSKQLIPAIMGGGGLILGINALMFVLNVLPSLFDNTTKTIKEQKEEVRKLADEYENLSTVQMAQKRRELEQQIAFDKVELESLKVDVPIMRGGQFSVMRKEQTFVDNEKAKDLQNNIAATTKKLIALDKISVDAKQKLTSIFSGSYDLSSIHKVRETISLLEKEMETVSTQAERDKYINKIKEMKNLEKKYRNELSTEGKKLLNEQDELQQNLILRLKEGKDKEFEELKQTYEDEKQIAEGNKKLLLMLEKWYRSEKAKIDKKWHDIELKKEKQHQKKIEEERRKHYSALNKMQKKNVLEYNPLANLKTEDLVYQNFQIGMMYSGIMALNDALYATGGQLATIGAAGAAAWAKNVLGIKQVTSVLQALIVRFAEAISQALLMRAVTGFLNVLLPGSGAAANIAVAAVQGLAEGAIVTKPTIAMIGEGKEAEGVLPLSELKNFTYNNKQGNGDMELLMRTYLDKIDRWQKEIELHSTIAGKDIHLSNKRSSYIIEKNKLK